MQTSNVDFLFLPLSSSVKALQSFGGRSVLEIVALYAGDTCRVVYTVRFEGGRFTCFMLFRRSQRGAYRHPQKEIDLIKQRLAAAESQSIRVQRFFLRSLKWPRTFSMVQCCPEILASLSGRKPMAWAAASGAPRRTGFACSSVIIFPRGVVAPWETGT